MRETGRWGTHLVKVLSIMLMETSMMAIGSLISAMVMEFILTKKVQSMRVPGKMTLSQGKGQKCGQKEANM
jgi:hypothetical protein